MTNFESRLKLLFSLAMQALILANGKGTNLRPLTVYTPKPIIPIVNIPFLLYQIEILKRARVEQITLFLDYQPDKIEHLLGTEQELGVELRYVVEPQPLGTAGAYKFASKYSSETTIILNGDILTDLVVAKLLKQHKESNSGFSITTTSIEPGSKYGLVKTDDSHRVTKYIPDFDDDEESLETIALMNAGIYVVEPDIANLITDEKQLSFKYDVFPDLKNQIDNFYAFPIGESYWCSIDSLEKYLAVHKDFLGDKIQNFKMPNGNGYETATSAFVDKKSVIGADCIIKPNARIINSVLGKGVKVEERAVIENSVIWSHTRISNSAQIRGSVIAGSCYIGKNGVVSEGSVLGDKTSLTDYTRV